MILMIHPSTRVDRPACACMRPGDVDNGYWLIDM